MEVLCILTSLWVLLGWVFRPAVGCCSPYMSPQHNISVYFIHSLEDTDIMAARLLLVKCFDNKIVLLPCCQTIFPLAQLQDSKPTKKYFGDQIRSHYQARFGHLFLVILTTLTCMLRNQTERSRAPRRKGRMWLDPPPQPQPQL